MTATLNDDTRASVRRAWNRYRRPFRPSSLNACETIGRGDGRIRIVRATEMRCAVRKRPGDIASIWRPAYVRDVEKIIHTPAYNRYAGKTQVFSFRANDDISRRGLHVQLVARIARDIGFALGLNCDLIEAIGLGHDLGHTPFGHAGERCLNDVFHEHTGRWFFHNVHSVRVLDALYGAQPHLADARWGAHA